MEIENYLKTIGLTSLVVENFIIENLHRPEVIYDACVQYGISIDVITDVFLKNNYDIDKNVVLSYFKDNGFLTDNLELKLVHPNSENGTFVEGGDDNEILYGTSGDDIIMGGKGTDRMIGGDGNDVFIVVGDLTGEEIIDTYKSYYLTGIEFAKYDRANHNHDNNASSEFVDGGAGFDTLVVVGTTNLSNYDFQGIENVLIL